MQDHVAPARRRAARFPALPGRRAALHGLSGAAPALSRAAANSPSAGDACNKHRKPQSLRHHAYLKPGAHCITRFSSPDEQVPCDIHVSVGQQLVVSRRRRLEKMRPSTPCRLSCRPRGSRTRLVFPSRTRVEEACRILQGRPFGEGHLLRRSCKSRTPVLINPSCDYTRNPSPFPFLDAVEIGFLYQGTDPAEHLAPPVAQFLDSRVYQFGWRFAFLRRFLWHVRFFPGQ